VKTLALHTLAVWVLVAAALCSGFGQGYEQWRTVLRALEKSPAYDSVWTQLKLQKQIPFVWEDSVAFLYRGNARTVEWNGDFNQWGYNKTFVNKGILLRAPDVWLLKARFEPGSRLDYKIVLNGDQWVLDPANPNQQWSGVAGGSPNSELRMPRWREDPLLTENPAIPKGKLIEDILLQSNRLGYQLTYSVYLPADYESLRELPVVYFTDGYEYLHPRMGNALLVLNNLIGLNLIRPVMAVFVDHREPANRANNRRMEELNMNPRYLSFFTEELLPEIEANYRVSRKSEDRAIVGTSMGGLSAAYFLFSSPGTFGKAGIQSPAFWKSPQVYALCDQAKGQTIEISMTTGTINDTSESTRKMRDMLEKNSCVYHYREVPDGHSWGNWRNLLDEVLTDLFGRNSR
jgi:enterochelin esterase family protein